MSSGALKKKNAGEFAYLAVCHLLSTHFYLLVTPWIASRCSQRRHLLSPGVLPAILRSWLKIEIARNEYFQA